MSSFEIAGWVLLSAFCLHQMKIMDVPQTFQQYTGVHIQQQAEQAPIAVNSPTSAPIATPSPESSPAPFEEPKK